MLLLKLFRSFYKKDTNFFNTQQFEEEASKILPCNIFGFFSGGAGEELSLKENTAIFDRIKLIPQVLRGIDSVSLTTKVVGQDMDIPLLIAPMAFQKLAHQQGEIAVAKAVSRHSTIMTASTLSTSSLEGIKQASSLSPWLQVYIYKDREITKNLIYQAARQGYKAIILTVDTPFYAKRLRELKDPLSLPSSFQLSNLVEAGLVLKGIDSLVLPHYLSSLLAPTICWKDIEWLRSLTSLPVLLKGILHPKDIQLAISHNVDGIILSNHGGRQLDTAITAIEALSLVKEEIKQNIDIIVDGGIRRGTDILKALALGAKSVMVGRPIIWGLAVDGEEGVFRVIHILKEELKLAMALCGISSIEQINQDIIFNHAF